MEKIKILLQKNMYPKRVIKNQIKTFLDKQFTVDGGTTSEKQKTLHYNLPYIGHFSHIKRDQDISVNVFVKALILRLHFRH